MGKILGSWSAMRKYLEKDMLADSLKERIRYGCTGYVGMDSCHIFEVCIDGLQVKRFSWETVNTYFMNNGFTQNPNPSGIGEYWAEFWELLEKFPIDQRTEYTDEEFCKALETYRNQDIQESIRSLNPIVRMFAILDRRVGKRTLVKIKDEVEAMPDWVKQFYNLRCEAEELAF